MNNNFSVGHALDLHVDIEFQHLREKVFCVALEEVHGSHGRLRSDDATDEQVIMATLQDHLTQPDLVPGP